MRNLILVTATAAAVGAASAPMSAQSLFDAVNPVKHFEKAVEVVRQGNDVTQILTAPAQLPTRITQGLAPGVHINPMNPLQPPRITTFEEAERNWRNLPRTIDNARTFGAAELAEAIRRGEQHAAMSAQPVPLWVRQALDGTVAPQTLDRARFSLNWGATANVTLQQFLLANYAEAVTLNTVIVFGSPDYALFPSRDNLERWRHELAHVEQYQREGIDGFAAWYARDVSSALMAGRRADPQLEQDARAIAAATVARIPYGPLVNGYAGFGHTGGYAGYSGGGPYAGYNAADAYAPHGMSSRRRTRMPRRNYDPPEAPVQSAPAPRPRPSSMPTEWGTSSDEPRRVWR